MMKKKYPISKFCLLTTQRSGSTWLNELLGSHPEIKLFSGEIFLNNPSEENIGWIKDENFLTFYDYRKKRGVGRPWITFDYLNKLDNYPGDHRAIGFHLMYNQLAQYPEILFRLIVDGYKVIHLERLNYLDTLISIANMNRRNIVHSRSQVEVSPIFLDVDILWKNLCRQEEKINIIKNVIRLLPLKVINITYESLKTDRDFQLCEICKFLDISTKNINFSSSLKKINIGTHSEKIENFDQVYEKLLGTRYESFIYD